MYRFLPDISEPLISMHPGSGTAPSTLRRVTRTGAELTSALR